MRTQAAPTLPRPQLEENAFFRSPEKTLLRLPWRATGLYKSANHFIIDKFVLGWCCVEITQANRFRVAEGNNPPQRDSRPKTAGNPSRTGDLRNPPRLRTHETGMAQKRPLHVSICGWISVPRETAKETDGSMFPINNRPSARNDFLARATCHLRIYGYLAQPQQQSCHLRFAGFQESSLLAGCAFSLFLLIYFFLHTFTFLFV
ncbi:MAG: hypothetical protein K0Q50_595 [Vampirovibrio sp.]|jgi:hypothetical protein|nr:hypothetical protein [Vampirovibrio sp.]